MKKNIHPKWNKNVPVVSNGQVIMHVDSTREELSVEIWSGNHPFYTGKETLVDTDNLVEKFNKKMEKASTVVNKKEKRQRRVEKRKTSVQSGPVTLKDMLSNLK
jgi:large subunit ribosomal protein L31